MSVEGYVGYWGSGKTLLLTRECLLAQKRDPNLLVFNNFGYNGPNAVHLETIDEIIAVACAEFDGRHKMIAIDEIGMLMRARGSSTWPPAGDVVFQQGRKLHLDVRWTTQHWRFLDVNVRRVTERVTECAGFFPRRVSPRGEVPIRKTPRLFRQRVFLGPNPESGELPAKCDYTKWWRFNKVVAESYSTMALVRTAQVMLRQQQAFSNDIEPILAAMRLMQEQIGLSDEAIGSGSVDAVTDALGFELGYVVGSAVEGSGSCP